MQTKNLLWILLAVLFTTFITSLPAITKASPIITLSVIPMTVTDINVGNTFTVNLTLSDFAPIPPQNKGLWGYQIYLKYNTTVLNATSFENLAYLAYASFNEPEYSAINNTAGLVQIAYHSSLGDKVGFTPTAAVPLASVTFQVNTLGTSDLEIGATGITETVLADAYGNAIDPDWNLLLVNGHFSNVGEIKLHDIAVTSVAASPTEVEPGGTVSIAVTVKNNGDFSENFTVSAYFSVTHKIQTLAVTNLAPGESKSLTFTWTTTAQVEGPYVVSANAEVAAEANPADNTLTGNTVTVKIPGGGSLPFNMWYIVGGIVVVIVVAIVFYALRARKK